MHTKRTHVCKLVNKMASSCSHNFVTVTLTTSWILLKKAYYLSYLELGNISVGLAAVFLIGKWEVMKSKYKENKPQFLRGKKYNRKKMEYAGLTLKKSGNDWCISLDVLLFVVIPSNCSFNHTY